MWKLRLRELRNSQLINRRARSHPSPTPLPMLVLLQRAASLSITNTVMNPNSPHSSPLNPPGQGYFTQKQTQQRMCRKGKQTRGETSCINRKWAMTGITHYGRKEPPGHVGPRSEGTQPRRAAGRAWSSRRWRRGCALHTRRCEMTETENSQQGGVKGLKTRTGKKDLELSGLEEWCLQGLKGPVICSKVTRKPPFLRAGQDHDH